MRTKILFDNIPANAPFTSDVLDFGFQDARFLIQLTKAGTDGNPRIIVEESVSQNIWTAMENTETWEGYFELGNDGKMGIKDNYFMGKYFRVRLEPNGVTTGTIYAEMSYKTKP